jgi:hypothetical protein
MTPGPVSDAYHPEFSTCDNADRIVQALQEMHASISAILDGRKPLYILELLESEKLNRKIAPVQLSEKEWRILRFACERAWESI